MKFGLFSFLLLFTISWSECYSQSIQDFKVEKIGKRVNEFQLDSINLSTPLNYYLSRAWVRLSGKGDNWNKISTSKFYNENTSDEVVDDALWINSLT